MNVNLDNIPKKKIYFDRGHIEATIKRFLYYRDWDNLTWYVLKWGIEFKVQYGSAFGYSMGEPIRRRCGSLLLNSEVYVLRCREWPYYYSYDQTSRKTLKQLIKTTA